MLVERINSPSDLKKLDINDLPKLCDEIREILIKRVTVTGGHMGSNLGIIEATVALHYVFDSPKDKFVFDVSHQSYTHKILTGRKEGYINPEKYDELSGYTTPSESSHDIFKVGHTSTSVSLALGLAKANMELKTKGNIIAIIGDGSLSGGEAFEGLNNAGIFKGNLIVLFNDNEMSIAVPVGGLNEHFKKLRETKGQCKENYFKLLGLDYTYLEEGNDVIKLVDLFRKVKDIDHPIVVHIHTQKGKGLKWAMDNKELGHYAKGEKVGNDRTYNDETRDILYSEIMKDEKVFVVNAATPQSVGLNQDFRKKVGGRFIDVGICEEHAVAYVSSMAKGGLKPVLVVKSSFMQRTYDQLNQDLSMNNTSAVILCMDAKIAGGDCTHVGMNDMSMVSSIPNLICLAPCDLSEYRDMIDYAVNQNDGPILIREPQGKVEDMNIGFKKDDLKKYRIAHKGEKIAILGLGTFFTLANEVCELLKEKGYNPTVVDPRIYSEVDKETLDNLKKDHSLVVTLEDGVLDGGFGERIARYYGETNMKVKCFGAEKNYNDKLPYDMVIKKNHLIPSQICDDILEIL